jgi:hypothetical protein
VIEEFLRRQHWKKYTRRWTMGEDDVYKEEKLEKERRKVRIYP